MGIAGPFVTSVRGDTGSELFLEAETHGAIITIKESSDDWLRGSRLEQLLTAGDLRNKVLVEGTSEDGEKNFLIRYTHKTSGFKTSGFKTSGTLGLQNISFTKHQVYKTSGCQNVRLSKRQVVKTSGL